jgi:hypothetical protein
MNFEKKIYYQLKYGKNFRIINGIFVFIEENGKN